MAYSRDIRIEFNHCDPAGIVFYPRYFEMTNSVVENYFRDVLDYPFERISMAEGRGVPTVHIECDFRAPSELGEVVTFTLEVVRVGRASVQFRITARRGGETRLTATLTLVWVNAKGRAESWPPAIRKGLEAARGKRIEEKAT
ncbi:thioesterase [Rhodobacteraceae bacterium WD3A24]|nr:thioesterase [Rhodobacteraceae bacterium WD3A24]